MKKRSALFLVLLLLTVSAVAQLRKKNKEAPVDSVAKTETVADTTNSIKPKNDSVKQTSASDSLNAQLTLYKDFYAYISNKFFPEKFKKAGIEKAITLTDSLSKSNESTRTSLQSLSKGKIDSLTLLLRRADTLQMENQTFKNLLVSLIGENVYPQNEGDLKGSWQVFVQPLTITGSGQESGIVSQDKMILPDSLYKASIDQIVFLEEDLADIYFFGGKKTKCFYTVNGFSREKTYTIFLQKGTEINIKLFVTPVPRGLQVSYKLGNGTGQYMFGYMRR